MRRSLSLQSKDARHNVKVTEEKSKAIGHLAVDTGKPLFVIADEALTYGLEHLRTKYSQAQTTRSALPN